MPRSVNSAVSLEIILGIFSAATTIITIFSLLPVKIPKKPYNLSTRILWLFEQHSFRGSLWRRQSNASIKAFTYCSFPTAEGIKASP